MPQTGFAEVAGWPGPSLPKVAVTDATVRWRPRPIGRVYEAPKGVSRLPGMVCRERGDVAP